MTDEQYELLNNVAIAGASYPDYIDDEQPMWKNIGPLCTGYGRMIHYLALGFSEDKDFQPDPTKSA